MILPILPTVETLQDPSRYPMEQLGFACLVAQVMSAVVHPGGKLVLCEPPRA